VAAAQAARGEEIVDNPDQFADPDDEKNIFAGTVYEQDDEEADRWVVGPASDPSSPSPLSKSAETAVRLDELQLIILDRHSVLLGSGRRSTIV
jgi:hypothetical protein